MEKKFQDELWGMTQMVKEQAESTDIIQVLFT